MCKAEEELMKDAHDNGIKKGMEKGKEKGIEEGMEKGKEEVALYLLKLGESIEFVNGATQISESRLLELKQSLEQSGD